MSIKLLLQLNIYTDKDIFVIITCIHFQDFFVSLFVSPPVLYRYDDDEEQITKYQRIFLEDIEKIEIGEMLSSALKYLDQCLYYDFRQVAHAGSISSIQETRKPTFGMN